MYATIQLISFVSKPKYNKLFELLQIYTKV